MIKYTDFYGNDIDETEEDLVSILQEIYAGCICSIYVAGSLMCEFKGTLHEFIIVPDVLDRKNYWTSKVYLKRKSPAYILWETAESIVKHCDEKGIS